MGILIITWNFPPRRGGIERIMARLYAGLHTSHSVQLITTQGAATENEIGVHRSPSPRFAAVFRLRALARQPVPRPKSRD